MKVVLASVMPLCSLSIDRESACGEDGAALLEFAIVLPILITLCFGCVELGRVLFAYAAVESAVRGGVRYLAQVPNPGCVPTCSWGASRAVDMTRDQIAFNTGILGRSIRVSPTTDDRTGMVALDAEVDVPLMFSGGLGRFKVWTVRVSRQEQKIEG
ncbi:MAG: hypothetical protein NVSMB6_25820 [Burkholderiaceae bacterium]